MTNPPNPRPPDPLPYGRRALALLMLVFAAAFLALHAVHLTADFPNFSPWMDWSKYTDEGWYGDAAIRHFQRGHWYVPGDFNPAAALPVWPLLEAIVFRFTGVSLVAARALTVTVFAGILISSWLLITRWSTARSSTTSALETPPPASLPDSRSPRSHSLRLPASLAAPTAVLLLAVSPFCFVFTRLAILEPMLILLTLLTLLAAGAVKPVPPEPLAASQLHAFLAAVRPNLLPIFALGLLLPAMVLTKTTALFLVPAVASILFAAVAYRLATFVRVGLAASTLALGLWLTYYGLIIRPRLLLDYHYLFSANAYTGITRENFFSAILDTFTDGMWMGNVLYPAAIAATLFALYRFRQLRAHPLIPALLLWAAGYTAFLAYHNNLQPRYYLVVAVPLTLLVPVVLEELVLPRLSRNLAPLSALLAAGVLIAAIVLPDARRTLHFVRHPEYTLVQAARQVNAYIAADRKRDPTHNPLVLSISGSEISLITGLPSICDDFGTLELDDRIHKYRPGWYVAWNQIDDDKMDSMTPLFHVGRVAAFPAMDDPERNLMILYRLDPTDVTPPRSRRRKPIPRQLKTKVGQQPSASQLEH